MSDWNTKIIDEFRANDGVVGGMFEGTPLLILHTTGARTGRRRLAPLMYRRHEDGYLIFGSKAGSHTHPDWYHNLLANPEASIEVGSETLDVKARVLTPEEREPIWSALKEAYPTFADYEQKTDRKIPAILLTPSS